MTFDDFERVSNSLLGILVFKLSAGSITDEEFKFFSRCFYLLDDAVRSHKNVVDLKKIMIDVKF